MSDCTIGEPDSGNALHLAPSTRTVSPAQPAQFADAPANGDRSLLSDLTKDFKRHAWLSTRGTGGEATLTELARRSPEQNRAIKSVQPLHEPGSLRRRRLSIFWSAHPFPSRKERGTIQWTASSRPRQSAPQLNPPMSCSAPAEHCADSGRIRLKARRGCTFERGGFHMENLDTIELAR